MDNREFAREVARMLPIIHMELVKKQPDFLLKERTTFPQMILLNILGGRNACKMSELSRTLGVTKSAVTGLVDRLIKSGLLRRSRSEKDRRVVYITLTSKGILQYRRLNAFRLRMIANFFSTINQKERAQYLNILRKIQKNILAKKR